MKFYWYMKKMKDEILPCNRKLDRRSSFRSNPTFERKNNLFFSAFDEHF